MIGLQNQLAVILPGGGPCGFEPIPWWTPDLVERYSRSAESKSTEPNRRSPRRYTGTPPACAWSPGATCPPLRGLFRWPPGVFQQVHQQGAQVRCPGCSLGGHSTLTSERTPASAPRASMAVRTASTARVDGAAAAPTQLRTPGQSFQIRPGLLQIALPAQALEDRDMVPHVVGGGRKVPRCVSAGSRSSPGPAPPAGGRAAPRCGALPPFGADG